MNGRLLACGSWRCGRSSPRPYPVAIHSNSTLIIMRLDSCARTSCNSSTLQGQPSRTLRARGTVRIGLSVSYIGAVSYRKESQPSPLTVLIGTADQALEAASAMGRHCVSRCAGPRRVATYSAAASASSGRAYSQTERAVRRTPVAKSAVGWKSKRTYDLRWAGEGGTGDVRGAGSSGARACALPPAGAKEVAADAPPTREEQGQAGGKGFEHIAGKLDDERDEQRAGNLERDEKPRG